MSAQRYERVAAHDDEIPSRNSTTSDTSPTPDSPPPSFRSRASSLAPSHLERQPLVDRTLADTFETASDDEEDDEANDRLDDRQRVMSGRPNETGLGISTAEDQGDGRPAVERRVTQLPVFAPATAATSRRYGGGNGGHDGVFANLSAKPSRGGEDMDEKPPTYEQAAADAAPPYWETTILSPHSHNPDDVYIDGLPVGSLFSFVWNAMISMSFQLVGFLLTYLLHTTHAAKNGSKAGLGITLVQYGFTMKGASSISTPTPGGSPGDGDFIPPPSDPNSHTFDPAAPLAPPADSLAPPDTGLGAMRATDWFAYALMIVGWFILIKSVSDYLKARRHERLVLQSPARGLGVAVVAEGEAPGTVV